MGLTPLIAWAVIDPVMRKVITETQGFSAIETRVLNLAFWHYIDGWDAGFKLCVLTIAVVLRRGLRVSRFGNAVMLRRSLQALRLSHCSERRRLRSLHFGTALILRCSLQALCLGHCSDVKTQASSSASWPLHEWLWLALCLKYRLCFLMTCS